MTEQFISIQKQEKWGDLLSIKYCFFNGIEPLNIRKCELTFCVLFIYLSVCQGDRISLSKQLRHHRITMSRIAILLGNKRLAKEYLSRCIYTVGMGSNDYINNYFMPKYYPTSFLYTPDQYAAALVKRYSQQITVSTKIPLSLSLTFILIKRQNLTFSFFN